jgi:hypothetical protein
LATPGDRQSGAPDQGRLRRTQGPPDIGASEVLVTTPIDGTATDHPAEGEADRRQRWPFLLVLGAPAFGTTFAITALTTHLPTLWQHRGLPACRW